MALVEVTNLSRTYGDVRAVDDVSFEIRQGEILGLLGPNGAGKTTTINVRCTYTEPTAGKVVVAGHSVIAEPEAVKRAISVVPQDIALYPDLNALENLRFFGRMYDIPKAKLERRIAELLQLVGLAEHARRRVEHYSGGMKRRLNLAVGLLSEPHFLVLDEPTVGVDPQSRNAIFENIQALNQRGLTILYTTHYLEEAELLCDRVAIMDEGQIIALDTPQRLINTLGTGIIRIGVNDDMSQTGNLNVETAYDKETARQLVTDGKRAGALVIPSGFSAAITSGNPTALELIVAPGGQTAPLLEGMVRGVTSGFSNVQTTVEVTIDEVQRATGSHDLDYEGIARRVVATTLERLKNLSVGARITSVGSTEEEFRVANQIVPGYAVMFAMFTVLSAAGGILEEKERGTFKRLLISPIPDGHYWAASSWPSSSWAWARSH